MEPTTRMFNENPDMFFQYMKGIVSEAKIDQWLDEFRYTTGHESQVFLVRCHHDRFDWFKCFTIDMKDDKVADDLIKDGNGYFIRKKYLSAMQMYLKAVLFADSTQCLKNAYEKRAYSLFMMGKYEECIEDCERVLRNGCPEEQLTRVRRMNRNAVLRRSNPTGFHDPVPQITRNNPMIPCASDKIGTIEIQNHFPSSTVLVAARKIPATETLIVEEPYEWYPINDPKMSYVCQECSEMCLNPIPCHECTWATYCGTECKEKAWKKYHVYECRIKTKLESCGVTPLGLLAVKFALQWKDQYAGHYLENLFDDSIRSDRLKELLSMNKRHQLSRREKYVNAAFGALLVRLLEDQTDFFVNEDETGDFKDMFLHILPLFYQRHTKITLLIQTPSVEVTPYGVAVYSVSSMLPHSCCPNAVRIFYGKRCVVMALKTIRENEKITVNYRDDCFYTDYPKELRRQSLRKEFELDCKCKACERNWPVLVKLTLKMDFNHQLWTDFFTVLKNTIDPYYPRQILSRHLPLFRQHEESEPSSNYAMVYKLIDLILRQLGNRSLVLNIEDDDYDTYQ